MKATLNQPNLHGTLAHTAAEAGSYALLLAHLNQFPGDINAKNDAKDTPLHRAATNGNLDCVRLLVERGARVGHEEINGWTPLICACNTGHTEVVDYLLDNNAGLRHKCELSWNVLHFAVFGGYYELTDLLLKRGAKAMINDWNSADQTPLDLALYKGYDNITELLKSNGGRKAHPDDN